MNSFSPYDGWPDLKRGLLLRVELCGLPPRHRTAKRRRSEAGGPIASAIRKANYAALSASFFSTSFFTLRALADNCASPAFISQLSSPPLCSTDRRPCVDTRSFTPLPSASDNSVTFCKLGRDRKSTRLNSSH